MFARHLRTGTRAYRQLSSMASMATSSQTPMEDTIRSKITASLAPSRLEIYNDSHKHAHHAPMAASTSKETHFRLVIASPEFRAKPRPARHRMVYALLRDEMARDHGIHALQLKTLTPEEDQQAAAAAANDQGAEAKEAESG